MKIAKRILLMGGILITIMGLVGCQSNSASKFNPQKQASESSTQNTKLAEYNGIIKTARSLNQDGQYKASNKALNQIEVSDLGKSEYSAIKTEYFNLQKSNDQFMLKKNKTTSKTNNQNNTNSAAPATNNSFNSYGQYTGDYYFYNTDGGDRNQSSLNISSNGTVIQNNQDGSTVISASSAKNILSYNVSDDSTDTKTINASVEIDVTWSNGEKEVYYGYIGYDNSTVLTDGISYHGDQVNEVWQKF